MSYENGKLPDSALADIKGGRLTVEAAAGWNAMNVEARSRGVEFLPSASDCAYRTYAQQEYYWDLYQSGQGNLAAQPGTSNHGWGTAVDLDTTEMRDVLDSIGAKYGWSKSWSDAPTEWWHVCYQAGHYSGPDPGPTGEQPKLEDDMAITVVVKQDGRLEAFVEDKDGQIWHTWQTAKNGGWQGSAPGKTTTWQSLGSPGAKK